VEKMRICDILLTGANRRYPEITEVIRERLDLKNAQKTSTTCHL
jgi:hypothetical protein